MPEFDAILFDFDGVLADTEPIHFACWAETLAPLGVRLEWAVFQERYVGMNDRDMVRLIAEGADPPRDWEKLWEHYPEKKQMFRDKVLSAPPFAPELGGFLVEVHRGYRTAVVTASARTEIEPLLAAGELSAHFDVLVCGKEAGKHKPEPDPYLLAAKLLGCERPLVVEDSEYGLASAAQPGLRRCASPARPGCRSCCGCGWRAGRSSGLRRFGEGIGHAAAGRRRGRPKALLHGVSRPSLLRCTLDLGVTAQTEGETVRPRAQCVASHQGTSPPALEAAGAGLPADDRQQLCSLVLPISTRISSIT